MDIFGGIDGTGPYGDDEYAVAFATSNVNKLAAMPGWNGGHFYDRGPGADGYSTGARADSMAANVVRAYRAAMRVQANRDARSSTPGPPVRIFLSGYSRGGAAVVNVAHTLNDQNIPVHCLLLFDAVDRSVTIWRTIVPDNVQMCFYARRDPASGSRQSFGNCSTTAQGGLQIRPRDFMCTHGAMGGTPWTEAESDGFIHERDVTTASTGTFSVGNLGRIAAGLGAMGATGSPVAGAAAADMYDRASKTNISLPQEVAGNRDVWNWALSNLQVAKLTAHLGRTG